jgi:hypothetical protein
MNCLDFDEKGWCYTGGENGSIYVWSEVETVKKLVIHLFGITAINIIGNFLYTGAKDQKIAIVSLETFKLTRLINVK